jgi:hypothetical protein
VTQVGILKACQGVVTQTLYVASGVLVAVDWIVPEGDVGRIGLLVFMAAATMSILARIDKCVGKVWDAGGRAERRRADLEASLPRELAVVHDLAPRR